MTKGIKAMYKGSGLKTPKGKGIHTRKFHSCVTQVAKKGGVKSPHAVCMTKLGRNKAVKKSHRRKGYSKTVGVA